MADCPACLAALTNPNAGEYRKGCLGCEIRAVSNAPPEARSKYYAQIANLEEREAFSQAVALEFRRRQKLRKP